MLLTNLNTKNHCHILTLGVVHLVHTLELCVLLYVSIYRMNNFTQCYLDTRVSRTDSAAVQASLQAMSDVMSLFRTERCNLNGMLLLIDVTCASLTIKLKLSFHK